MLSLTGRDSCPPVSRNLHALPPARDDRRVGKSRMIQRALALFLAAGVLPIAAGSAFDQPAPRPITNRETAKIPSQRSALASAERNEECDGVTAPDVLAAVTAPGAEPSTKGGASGCA